MADTLLISGTSDWSSVDLEVPPSVFDPLTRTRRGFCPVKDVRNGKAFSIHYEIHGSGPEKIVWIMGMNSTAATWLWQIEYFGNKREYTSLVFDNRGVGSSGRPRGMYTTSEMANDVIALLDHVGWTGMREIHVVGVSLGGMIAQELASRITDRVVSLSLISTKAGKRQWPDLPSSAGLKTMIKANLSKKLDRKAVHTLDLLYPKDWLNAKRVSDPDGRTNGEIEADEWKKNIELNRQSFHETFRQMAAALSHYVSPSQLQALSSMIPKVLIMTGGSDLMVPSVDSRFLKDDMPEAELIICEDAGHGVCIQCKDWTNALLEKTFKEGRERAEQLPADGTWA